MRTKDRWAKEIDMELGNSVEQRRETQGEEVEVRCQRRERRGEGVGMVKGQDLWRRKKGVCVLVAGHTEHESQS